MIRFFFTAFALFTITTCITQVDFQSISFEDALKKAEKEDKLVFVDVYAEWCGPCKMLDRNVFSDEALGKKMNASFVSIKVDGDQEESNEIKLHYEISAYPTMLMINPKTDSQRKIEGYIDTSALKKEMDYALHPQKSPANVAKAVYEKNPTRENFKEWIEEISDDNGSSVEELYAAIDLFVEKYPDLDFDDEVEVVIFITSIKGLEDENVKRFIADIENQDPEIVQYVFMQLIRTAFAESKKADDLSIVQQTVKEAHPLFKSHIDEELTEQAMLELVEEAFNE